MSHYAEYKSKKPDDIAEIARTFPFALVCKNGFPELPDIISVPVLLRPGLREAEFHMARENPAAPNFIAGGVVRVVFRGPAAHISPTWYKERWRKGGDRARTAPTYNYVEAYVTGMLKTMSDVELKTHLHKLVSHFEGEEGWRFVEMNEEFYQALSAKIIGFTLDVQDVEAVFKLSQEQNPADAPHIRQGLRERNRPYDETLAALMEKYRAS